LKLVIDLCKVLKLDRNLVPGSLEVLVGNAKPLRKHIRASEEVRAVNDAVIYSDLLRGTHSNSPKAFIIPIIGKMPTKNIMHKINLSRNSYT
jgi:hypothetical protein